MTTSSGLVLVDKGVGPTSHDVVARLRRLLSIKRIGHAGTLDPMASGLLVIGVGPATRLLKFAQATTKTYTGTVRLGAATDTLDAQGVVVATAAVPDLDVARVNEAARTFLGAQEQIPPMVSALKVEGRRLYEMARAGEVVERAARPVEIHHFALTPGAISGDWDFEVRCSVGTYVRVLASDLAERLGTLGHLTALRRVASGAHHVDEARTLEGIEEALARGEDVVRPARDLVANLAVVTLDAAGVEEIAHGRPVDGEPVGGDGEASEVACCGPGGELVAIASRRDARWWPSIVLVGADR